MEEITPANLKAKVETLSRKYNFPIHNLFAAKDDYSLPEIEAIGLMRRPETLIGCIFSDEMKYRKVFLEYRLFKGEFDSFIAVITDKRFKEFPKAKKIVESRLSETGIRLQPNRGMIVGNLDPSIDEVEKFLSTYFQAQKQADDYIGEDIRMSEKLNSRYSIP